MTRKSLLVCLGWLIFLLGNVTNGPSSPFVNAFLTREATVVSVPSLRPSHGRFVFLTSSSSATTSTTLLSSTTVQKINGGSNQSNDEIDHNNVTESSSSSSPSVEQTTLLSSRAASLGKTDEPLEEVPSDQRYSSSDWWHNIRSLPGSLILRAIRGPVLAATAWAFVFSLLHAALLPRAPSVAARLCMSDKPHSFLASALGLLLVFRTNSAYQRFAEARAIWERILSVSRNLSRQALLMEKDLGTDRLERILRLLATFPYMLDEHIHRDDNDSESKREQKRLKAIYEAASTSSSSSSSSSGTSASSTNASSTSSTATDEKVPDMPDVLAVPRHVYRRERGSQRRRAGSIKIQYIDTQALPWCLLPDVTRRRCAVAENRPLYICDRLSREIYTTKLTPNFTHRERATFLAMVDSLSSSMGACERIHQTAVPLNYARHALRCVSLWLFTLPLALVKDFGLATAPVVMCLVRYFV